MKIGLQILRFDWPDTPPTIRKDLSEIAKLADDTGFASLWVMDHFFQMGDEFGPADAPMLESYTTMGYLAALTQRIRLGVLVTGNLYRYPGLLIKTVSTRDVLSGGRSYFGIGAGWYERETRGLGVPYPACQERFRRLEETLQIAKHMWSGQRTPYMGRYCQLLEPINSPPPLQSPHPPILIGGEGEKKTLRLVAKYGDACNLHAGGNSDEYEEGIQSVRHKLGVLRQHCESVGRPYSDIERTVLAGIQATDARRMTSDVIRLCESLAEIGVQHVIFNFPLAYEMRILEVLGHEVIPQVTDLRA